MELRARWPLLSDCCEVFKCQLCAAACNDVQYMLLQLLQTP
jgi:Mor family transcriptional regulator